jgi:glycogen operon protein
MTYLTWAAKEGSPTPLGVSWIGAEQAYNFAFYSKYADTVTLLLYEPEDLVNPILTYVFDPLRNKTGRVWHARIPRSEMQEAKYYAYSIDGPPPSGGQFERHAFRPEKILLDPYAGRCSFRRPSTELRRWASRAMRAKHLSVCSGEKNRPLTGAETNLRATIMT